MTDTLVHMIDRSRHLSVVTAETTELCREAETRHFCGRIPAIALAKTLTGAALISSGLKDDERQSVQINFNGALRAVRADADSGGNLRGFPIDASLPELDDSSAGYVAALGTCSNITVVRWRKGNEPYSGTIEVQAPTIRNDFSEYLARSEQLFADIELLARYSKHGIERSTGLLLRLLPGGDETAFEALRLRFKSGEVFDELTATDDPAEVARRLLPGAGVEEILRRPLAYRCPCTKERVMGMLFTLGSEQVGDILQNEGETEVTCQYCNSNYAVGRADLEMLLARMRAEGRGPRPSRID